MMARWEPVREPIHVTLIRTLGIAAVVGAVLSSMWGGLARWPAASLLALWPALGGHFVELGFLNWLRPRLPDARGVQVGARLAVWFGAGIGMLFAMRWTALLLLGDRAARGPAWWISGLAFIGIELVAHLGLQLRGLPSFYNGRG